MTDAATTLAALRAFKHEAEQAPGKAALVSASSFDAIIAALEDKVSADLFSLRLCEQNFLTLKPDTPYVFTVDPTCHECCKLAVEGDPTGTSPYRDAIPEPSAERPMRPIPISAARNIAEHYGYDQIYIISRRTGEAPNPTGEHVTTYGVNKAHCDTAAKVGAFLKHKVMGWPEYTPPDLKAQVIALADEREAGYRNRENGNLVNGRTADKLVQLAETLR